MSEPLGAPATSRRDRTRPLILAAVLGALAASLATFLTVALVVYLALALSD